MTLDEPEKSVGEQLNVAQPVETATAEETTTLEELERE